ncbi:MAG: hypothetical protein QY309_03475 [Cyclobacteriaceae bacterium]|nr:MAG: hypothetical protein QY309_03475 [Cyclobacteriaceae bacterium]
MRLLIKILLCTQLIYSHAQSIDNILHGRQLKQNKRFNISSDTLFNIASLDSLQMKDVGRNQINDTFKIYDFSLKWSLDSINSKRINHALKNKSEIYSDSASKLMFKLNEYLPIRTTVFHNDFGIPYSKNNPLFESKNNSDIILIEKVPDHFNFVEPEMSPVLNGKAPLLSDSLNLIESFSLPDSLPEIGLESVESDIQKYLDSDQLENSLLQRTEISEVNELIDEAELEAEKAKRMYDPQVAKEELVNKAKVLATNHFAGHEEELKSAMDKVAKLKAKLKETDEVVTLLRNRQTVKQKRPLIERFRPGITVQLSKANAVRFDFNPYIAYQVFSPIFVGLGWNQRAVFDHSSRELVNSERVFGPRLFFDYSLKMGFVPHFEIEYLNAPVKRLPDNLLSERQWVWTSMVGMKKEYRISKSLQGNIQVLYNIFDFKHKSPYVNKLNVRMGIDISIHRKKIR